VVERPWLALRVVEVMGLGLDRVRVESAKLGASLAARGHGIFAEVLR
jgi:hypothetical protein